MSKLFSDRLKELRGTQSKADFARALGIPAPMYHRYENGQIPQYDNLKVISDYCGKTVDWLLKGQDPPEVGSRENIMECLANAHDKMREHPDGERMVKWVATSMLEATEALREHEAGNQREAYARAYESQRVFGRIFRTAFDQQ